MSSIPSFQASLIQNIDVNKPSAAPTVEEILARTPEPASQDSQETKRRTGVVPKLVTAAVALAALGYAGRKGWLSKRVQKWLGGKPKPTQKQIQDKINTQLNEYISRTRDNAFDIKVLGNGKTRAERIKENGNKEIIVFSSKTGLPEMRLESNNAKGNNALEYVVWKGADILDEGFDALNNFYKKYTRSAKARKHPFGPKVSVAETTYGEMANPEGITRTSIATRYYKDGTIDRATVFNDSQEGSFARDFLYGKDGKLKGLDIISADGTIIRHKKGELPVLVRETNRKSSRWQKFLDIFARSKKNVIE